MRLGTYLVGIVALTGIVLRQAAAAEYDTQQASYQSVADMESRLAELEAQLANVQQAGYAQQASYTDGDNEQSYMPPEPNSMPEQGMPAQGYAPQSGYGNCNCQNGYAGGGYSGCDDGCGSYSYPGCGCANGGYACGDGCGCQQSGCGCCDGGYTCGDDCGCGCCNSCGCDPGCGCEPDCGCDCGDDGCCLGDGGCWGGRAVYSGEFLMLRPQESESDGSQSKLESGSRFTLGYTNTRDQTLRARYFEYGANEIHGSDYLRLQMLDLEYAGGFCLGRGWTGEIGAGVRWAKYDQEFEIRYDDSIGPEIGVELTSCPWFCMSVFASVRQSLQFGHPFEYSDTTLTRGDLASFAVTEMQVGLQWQRCCRGNTLYCRGTFEAQNWSGLARYDSEDERLVGWGVTVGITR
jgi:hypothetical protein